MTVWYCNGCGNTFPRKRRCCASCKCQDIRLRNIPSAVKLSERDVERTCTDFLALDGWRPLKTDPCSDRSRAKGFGEKGMADHLYIRYIDPSFPERLHIMAEVLWVEWKRLERNGKPTLAAPHQRLWQAAERKRGALVLLAGEDFPATIEGFQEWYRNSGLLRRQGL